MKTVKSLMKTASVDLSPLMFFIGRKLHPGIYRDDDDDDEIAYFTVR